MPDPSATRPWLRASDPGGSTACPVGRDRAPADGGIRARLCPSPPLAHPPASKNGESAAFCDAETLTIAEPPPPSSTRTRTSQLGGWSASLRPSGRDAQLAWPAAARYDARCDGRDKTADNEGLHCPLTNVIASLMWLMADAGCHIHCSQMTRTRCFDHKVDNAEHNAADDNGLSAEYVEVRRGHEACPTQPAKQLAMRQTCPVRSAWAASCCQF